MKDAKCAEANEKINLPIFAIFYFSDMVDFVLKIVQFSKDFEYRIDHNSKMKNRMNRRFDFSFASAYFASL